MQLHLPPTEKILGQVRHFLIDTHCTNNLFWKLLKEWIDHESIANLPYLKGDASLDKHIISYAGLLTVNGNHLWASVELYRTGGTTSEKCDTVAVMYCLVTQTYHTQGTVEEPAYDHLVRKEG